MKTELRERILGYVGGGFGLVAALAWNEAISALIAYLFPFSAGGIAAKFAYALIVTVVVVMVVTSLARVFSDKSK